MQRLGPKQEASGLTLENLSLSLGDGRVVSGPALLALLRDALVTSPTYPVTAIADDTESVLTDDYGNTLEQG